MLNTLKTNIGIVPTAKAMNGTIAILGITERSINTIAKTPNPNHDIAATKRNLFTYFSGYIEILDQFVKSKIFSLTQLYNIPFKLQ